MVIPRALIYKVLFPSISTFETPPIFGGQASTKIWRRRPSPHPGGNGRGSACCQGSIGHTKLPGRVACGGKPSYRGLGQRGAPCLTSTVSPSGLPPMSLRSGKRGLRSRSRLFSVPRQRWKAATVLWRNSITISGDYRRNGTRCGPSCIISMVTPQTVQHRRRGFSDGHFQISLKRCYLVFSRWREIRACNDNVCGESKSQNFHDSLLDLTFLIAATAPKAPIY